MIINENWSIKQTQKKRARFEEIHQINVQILKDLKEGKLRQNKHKGISKYNTETYDAE